MVRTFSYPDDRQIKVDFLMNFINPKHFEIISTSWTYKVFLI